VEERNPHRDKLLAKEKKDTSFIYFKSARTTASFFYVGSVNGCAGTGQQPMALSNAPKRTSDSLLGVYSVGRDAFLSARRKEKSSPSLFPSCSDKKETPRPRQNTDGATKPPAETVPRSFCVTPTRQPPPYSPSRNDSLAYFRQPTPTLHPTTQILHRDNNSETRQNSKRNRSVTFLAATTTPWCETSKTVVAKSQERRSSPEKTGGRFGSQDFDEASIWSPLPVSSSVMYQSWLLLDT
jgi:hypothetical protein